MGDRGGHPLVDVLEFHLDAKGRERLGYGADEYHPRPTEHPMAYAQYASGLAYIAGAADDEAARELCAATIEHLVALRHSHAWCWGLDFPWRERDAHHPYAITTAMAGIALLDAYDAGVAQTLDVASLIGRWLVRDLPWESSAAGAAPHYSPTLSFTLPNVAGLVAAFLLRASACTQNDSFARRGEDALAFVLAAEEEPGMWLYGATDDTHATAWPRPADIVDVVHTAYVFEALAAGMQWSAFAPESRRALERGIEFVARSFANASGRMNERLAVGAQAELAETSPAPAVVAQLEARVLVRRPAEARLWSYGALLGVLSDAEAAIPHAAPLAGRVCGYLLRTMLTPLGRFRYRSGEQRFFPRHESHAFAGLARYAARAVASASGARVEGLR